MVVADKENLQVYMQTINCKEKDCLFRGRVGKFMYQPVTRMGPLTYCPLCGGKAYATTDNEQTYWEILSEGYGLPENIVRELYAIWPRDEFPKLIDFVNKMKKDAGLPCV